MKNLAVIVLSESGRKIGKKIKKGIQLTCGKASATNILQSRHSGYNNLKLLIEDIFDKYDGLIFIMATGIVVRMIADLIQDKRTDPAVVVIDEKGKYVISLLSGHAGGANKLAKRVAGILKGAIPIITTSSDINNKPSLDMIFDELGWVAENPLLLPKISYSLINGEDIYVYDNTNILKTILSKEKNVTFLRTIKDMKKGEWKRYIFVSNKIYEEHFTCQDALLVRPKNIIIGIGCKKGINPQEVEYKILNFLNKANISVYSIKKLATIDIKKDEEGINMFSKKYSIPVVYFRRDEINRCKSYISSSKKVSSLIGAKGVCEPVVILSGAKNLLKKKTKMENLTLAAGEIV